MLDLKRTGLRQAAAWLWAAIAASSVLMVGCGGEKVDPNMGQVTGTVKYNGTSLTKGTVTFIMGTTSGSGAIDAQGHYKIVHALPPGDYQVSVQAEESPATMDAQGKPVPAKSLIPAKYSSPATSGLTAKVNKGKNDIPLDLKP